MRFAPVADSAGDRNRTPGGRSGQRPSIRAARWECGCRFCRNLRIGGTMAVAVLAGMSDTVAVFAAIPSCLVVGVWGMRQTGVHRTPLRRGDGAGYPPEPIADSAGMAGSRRGAEGLGCSGASAVRTSAVCVVFWVYVQRGAAGQSVTPVFVEYMMGEAIAPVRHGQSSSDAVSTFRVTRGQCG